MTADRAVVRQSVPGDLAVADEVGAMLGALAARTLRHHRRALIHLVGGVSLRDPDVVGRLRQAVPESPVVVLDGPSMRQLLDAEVPGRLHTSAAALRLMDANLRDVDAHQVLCEPRRWWAGPAQGVTSGAVGLGLGLLQSFGDVHPWWRTFALALLGVAAIGGIALLTPEVWTQRRLLRLARPFRGDRTVAAWLTSLTPSGWEAVLARAFLLDLLDEWGWRSLLSSRRVRGPYPVLLLPRDPSAPGSIFIEEYERFARLPVLLVTDRPAKGEPVPLREWRTLRTRPGQAWIVDAAQGSATWPPTPTRRRRSAAMANLVLAGVYRRLVVTPRSRLLLAVLALAASAGGAWAVFRPPAPCQDAPPSDIVVEDGQRIGYQFCGPSFADGDLEPAVYAENLRVSRLVGNGRLVVTMLLVTALTNSPQNSRSIVAEQEGVAGAYAAQMRINSTAGNLPLVRIAVANAGYPASHAGALANRVRALVDADPTVVAAVVTLDSIDVVHQGLARLTGTGLAMASPTMSADGFGAGLPTFLQLTAPNSDQAQLAFNYATRVAPHAAIVVIRPDPDTGDRYTATLSSAMAAAGPGVTEVRWAPGRLSLSSICSGAAPRPVVYYAGRFTRFPGFIADLQLECGAAQPMVIADDSTGRFLADRSLAGSVPHGTTVVVTVRGDLLSCHSLSAPTSADKADGTAGRRADFRTDIQKYLGRCGGIGAAAEAQAQADNPADVAGGWAACVYDTLRMLYEATRRVTLRDSGRLGSRAGVARLLTVDDPRDHHIYAGALRPIALGADRVARTGAVLYCVPELAEAFTHGVPTAVAERRDGETHILAATSPCDLTNGSGAIQ